MQQMKVLYNRTTDTLYYLVREGRSFYTSEFGDIRLDFNENGEIIALNIQHARHNVLSAFGIRTGEPEPVPELEAKAPLKIRIDRDACLGFGSCVSVAPRVFQLDEQSDTVRKSFFLSRAKIEVLDDTAGDYETILRAAQACPTKAIILADPESGEQVYP